MVVVAGMVFARPLIEAYAGDFASVPGKIELTVQLTRVMLPFLSMVAAAAAMMGMLNSLHHYFVPALAPAIFNIATILGAVLLVPLMPALGLPPIMAIAFAALAGGLGQIGVQWPALRREGFRYRVTLDPRDPVLRRMLTLTIVGLLFEPGHFLPANTAATAAAVRFYAIGLAGYSAARIASPTFYAIGESRVPAMVSGGVIAVNAAASILLVRALGFEGLALGTSIAAFVNAGVLLWLLRRRLDGLDGRRLSVTLLKVTLAALAMAVATPAIQQVMRFWPGSGLVIQAVRLAAAIGGGLVARGSTARLLRIDEFEDAVGKIGGRVRKLLADRHM